MDAGVRGVIAVTLLAAVAGIVVWMVQMGRRDYREMRTSSDRSAPFEEVARARLAGVLVVAPLLPVGYWVDPPALTWIGTMYLVAAIVVLGRILVRRGRK